MIEELQKELTFSERLKGAKETNPGPKSLKNKKDPGILLGLPDFRVAPQEYDLKNFVRSDGTRCGPK